MPRINVYHHETQWMADRGAEIVTKDVADTGNRFYGIRFYTEDVREHEPGDDDSAAITIWLPWTRADGHDVYILERLAAELHQKATLIRSLLVRTDPTYDS